MHPENVETSGICFIGGGNMASALLSGLQQAGKLLTVHVIDPHLPSLEKIQQNFSATVAQEIDAQAVNQQVIVLAVKPQQMREVAERLAPLLKTCDSLPLVISIAAGIRGADIIRWLGGYPALVRCMPNTPALIGKGVTGMVAWPEVTEQQKQQAATILSAVGSILWLEKEEMLNAVTAVSGSGPAYVFYFIEAMQAAAQELGFDAEQSKYLALATFDGAVQLAQQSSDSVQVLREKVTSKGGTTFAAISSMQAAQIKQGIIAAIHQANARSQELGEELGKDADCG